MSLRRKLLLSAVVLSVLAVATLGLLLTQQFRSFFEQHSENQLLLQSRIVMLALRQSSGHSLAEVDERLKSLATAGGYRITLIDSTGTVLLDSNVPFDHVARVENHLLRPEVQEALRSGRGTARRKSATVHHEFLYLAVRVASDTLNAALPALAIVRVSLPIESLRNATSDFLTLVLAVCGATLVVMVLVSMYFSRRLSRPIAAIADSVQRIRAGDLDTKLAVYSNDEVGRVATAVNELVDTLNRDIAQLKKLEQVRSEFLGNVSHELRTPIFSIQGFLETLLDGAVDDPRVNRVFLAKALAQSKRLDALLGDLIEISRIESGDMKLSFRYFAVGAFIEHVLADARPLAEAASISLESDLADPDVQVFGDKERLKQVLMNLIGNAIKYNTPRGSIRVVAGTAAGGHVAISVRDSGIGIGAEHIERIFERFYRADKERSRETGGTGLGLAIVKHIVEAHSSKIEVQSELGVGSTFTFYLKT